MVLDGDVAADRVHREVAKDRGERLRLDPDADVVGRAEHPHVGLHLALAVEERRVGALAGLERLDVVGQLPLQVLGRVRAADHDDAARADRSTGLLAKRAVLPIELNRNAHPPSVGRAGRGDRPHAWGLTPSVGSDPV